MPKFLVDKQNPKQVPGKKIPTKEEVLQMVMKPKPFPYQQWFQVTKEEGKFEHGVTIHLNKSSMLWEHKGPVLPLV